MARHRILIAAALLAGVWCASLAALQELFVGAEWTLLALALIVVVLGTAAALRVLAPKLRAAGWIAGLAAGGGVLAWRMAAAGRLTAWLNDPLAQLQETQIAVMGNIPPIAPTGPVLDLLAAAWLACLALSGLLLTQFGRCFTAGLIPALLILAPTAVTALRVPAPLLFAAGVLLVLLLWAGAPPTAWRWRGIVAAGVTLALAAGIFALMPQGRDRVWNTSAIAAAPVGASVPDVTIALAEDLQERSNTVVFDYRGAYHQVPGTQHFVLAQLADFAGGTWEPMDALDAEGASVLRHRAPELAGQEPEIAVRTKGLLSSWLPLPAGATQVRGAVGAFDPEQWTWVAGTQTARSTSEVTRPGGAYRATVSPRGLLEEEIDRERFLRLPGTVPDDLAQTARAVTADGDDDAARAALLTTWFRSGAFAYDERAPYAPGADPDDPYAVMQAFLEQRSGYCVHFATTYAVMARSLGVPTRVAVGYASRPNDGWTPVRARDLHAWPEVFIDGAGWVPVEPTPGGAGYRAETGEDYAENPPSDGTPVTPSGEESSPEEPAADADGADPDAPDAAEDDPESTDPDATSPGDDAADGGEGSEARSREDVSALAALALPARLVALVALALLAALCVLPTVRGARRGRRLRQAKRGQQPATHVWEELMDRALDLGAGGAQQRARARTPEAQAEALAEALPDHATALDALAEAVVAERFAEGERPAADAASLLDRLATVARALGRRRGRRARIRAWLFPRSVLARR